MTILDAMKLLGYRSLGSVAYVLKTRGATKWRTASLKEKTRLDKSDVQVLKTFKRVNNPVYKNFSTQ